MENDSQNRRKRKTITAVIAVASIAMILFLCIFSLYHLPERDPVVTPPLNENAQTGESPVIDLNETDDVLSASQEDASEMIGELEMQYENAKINNEPYQAQQAGLRLALAYFKAGQTQQALEFTNSLMQNYSYDQDFVTKCQDLIKVINDK